MLAWVEAAAPLFWVARPTPVKFMEPPLMLLLASMEPGTASRPPADMVIVLPVTLAVSSVRLTAVSILRSPMVSSVLLAVTVLPSFMATEPLSAVLVVVVVVLLLSLVLLSRSTSALRSTLVLVTVSALVLVRVLVLVTVLLLSLVLASTSTSASRSRLVLVTVSALVLVTELLLSLVLASTSTLASTSAVLVVLVWLLSLVLACSAASKSRELPTRLPSSMLVLPSSAKLISSNDGWA